jgi:hypothetical protein
MILSNLSEHANDDNANGNISASICVISIVCNGIGIDVAQEEPNSTTHHWTTSFVSIGIHVAQQKRIQYTSTEELQFIIKMPQNSVIEIQDNGPTAILPSLSISQKAQFPPLLFTFRFLLLFFVCWPQDGGRADTIFSSLATAIG